MDGATLAADGTIPVFEGKNTLIIRWQSSLKYWMTHLLRSFRERQAADEEEIQAASAPVAVKVEGASGKEHCLSTTVNGAPSSSVVLSSSQSDFEEIRQSVRGSARRWLLVLIGSLCFSLYITLFTSVDPSGVLRHLQEESADLSSSDEEVPSLGDLGWQGPVGLAIIIVALAIAAAGGIGGGAIFVPVLVLIMDFPTKYATPLSNITIFGGAIANAFYNIPRRHPKADRPLIDFDVFLIMEPMTICGTVIGSFLTKMFPNWLISCLLAGILYLTSSRTLTKGYQKYKKETARKNGAADVAAEEEELAQGEKHEGQQAEEGVLGRKDGSGMDGGVVQDDERVKSKAPTVDDKVPSNVAQSSPKEKSSSPPQTLSVLTSAAPASSDVAYQSFSSPKPRPGDPTVYSSTHVTDGSTGSAAKAGSEIDGVAGPPVDCHGVAKGDSPLSGLKEGTGGGDLCKSTSLTGLEKKGSHAEVKGSDGLDALTEEQKQAKLEEIREEERNVPVKKIGYVFVCYVGVVVASILTAVVACASFLYWFFLWVEVPWILAFEFFAARYLAARHKLKLAVGHEFIPGEIKWTKKGVVMFPSLCIFAGMAAGLFGVGGGVINGPLMLELGILPEVAAATSSLMILFTSASACVKFISFGLMTWEFAAILFPVGLFVTLFSQVYVSKLVKRSGRDSIIILLIGTGILIGAVLMTFSAIDKTKENAGKPFEVDFCD